MLRQHLIDPEICIRCNTCEETCPVHAITHDDNNYVVDASICKSCRKCISPCPTGAIDNWHIVRQPYTKDAQFLWAALPAEEMPAIDLLSEDDEAVTILAEAHKGHKVTPLAPRSAAAPSVNLYNRAKPAHATVIGNFRLTASAVDHDIRHIVLDFGSASFPVLEGQSLGVIPPGSDAQGAPHRMRLYSIASPRDGEKPNTNFVALTVKRVPGGICSNYVCDLAKGETVDVTGPYGATFLLPEDPSANILMICTGTGSAPFRAFIARRGRTMPKAPGKLMLYFGARRPEELPYFGPLQKLPPDFLTQSICFSRALPKTYVQDAIRQESAAVANLLVDPATHVFICGLKAMESGLDEAFSDVSRRASLNWVALKETMRASGRIQIETY